LGFHWRRFCVLAASVLLRFCFRPVDHPRGFRGAFAAILARFSREASARSRTLLRAAVLLVRPFFRFFGARRVFASRRFERAVGSGFFQRRMPGQRASARWSEGPPPALFGGSAALF
jgi:hypothetical protein